VEPFAICETTGALSPRSQPEARDFGHELFLVHGRGLTTSHFSYAKELMNASPQQSGILLIAVTIGIGLGSFGAGRFLRGKVELGLVPLGALGMSIFALDLLWAYHSLWRALVDFFLIGLFGGFLRYSFGGLCAVAQSGPGTWARQWRRRTSFLLSRSFCRVVLLYGLGSVLHLNPAQVFFSLGILSLAMFCGDASLSTAVAGTFCAVSRFVYCG